MELVKMGKWNLIEYYFEIPIEAHKGELKVMAETKLKQDIFIKEISIKLLRRK
jgi:hypothetical protein